MAASDRNPTPDRPATGQLACLSAPALHERLAAALGDAADEAVLRSLDLAYSGAMLWAGMGHIHFEDVPEALADTARQVLGGSR